MTIPEHACPVCRDEMQPTWYREIRGANGQVTTSIPMDHRCPRRCDQHVPVEDYNKALRQLDKDRANERRDDAD